MAKGNITYKGLDPACTATVRRLKGDDADAGRLRAMRRKDPLARIAMDDSTAVSRGAAVQVEMLFPARGVAYRCLGSIDWTKETGDPARPHRLGIGIYSMDRSEMAEQRPPGAAAPRHDPSQAQTMAVNPESLAEKGVSPPSAVVLPPPEPEASPKKVASHLSVPEAKEMGTILTSLLGDEINVSLAKAPVPASDLFVVGTYVSDSETIAVVCGADAELSVGLGAALGMIPVAEAKLVAASRNLSEPIRENLQEIFNIVSTVLNKSGNQHIKFGELLDLSRSPASEAVLALIEQPADRVDYHVEIPSYGAGSLCLLMTPCESPPEP
jgi:hypothetical protein